MKNTRRRRYTGDNEGPMSIETETNSTLESLLDGSAPAETADTSAEPAGTVETPEPTGEKPHDAAPPAAETPAPEDGFLTDGEKAALVAQARDERRKRQEFERQFSELQRQMQALQQPRPEPQQQAEPDLPPDPWTDPEGALAWHNRRHETEIYRTRVVMSEELMSAKPDYADMKQAFFEAVQADPSLAHKLVKHPLPAKFVYQEGKKYLAQKRIGDDPDAYEASLREQIEAEIMAKLGTQSPQHQAPRAPAPKSLAGTTSTQPRDPKSGRYAPSGPASLEELLD